MSYGTRSLKQWLLLLDEGAVEAEDVQDHARRLVDDGELDAVRALAILEGTPADLERYIP